MKKILSINGTSFYSTGNIIKNIEAGLKDKYDFYRATADEKGDKQYEISGKFIIRQSGKIPAQLFGNDGFEYRHQTKKMIKWIDGVKPDLIHIHNVHGYFMNVELVLEYAYSHNIPVIYTMHDCWTFTGRCAYFDNVNCDKWKTGCGNCKYKNGYPKSRLFDISKSQWLRKKRLFTDHGITFVAPSQWLKNYTVDSFLNKEKVLVINNGIDTSTFKPVKTSCSIEGVDPSKKIILSIANPFTIEKGLNDINELAKIIDKNKYQIVIVGEVAKKYKLEDGIISAPPTKSKEEIAKYYNMANVFCFFSHQDNYPTVLLESLACGTPVVTFKIGGAPEIVEHNRTGYVVEVGDIQKAYEYIEQIDNIDTKICSEIGKTHSIANFVKEYKELYDLILEDSHE